MRTIERGYFLGGRSHTGPATIGGRDSLPNAISPYTGEPLLQLASVLVTQDAFWLPRWESKRVYFLYSWTCSIHEGVFSYRQTGETIEIVEYTGSNKREVDFPYADYPQQFDPVQFDLDPISAADQEILNTLNGPNAADFELKYEPGRARDLAQPRHQFGGLPFLLQSDACLQTCPICRTDMALIAAIGNENFSTPQGFVGEDFVQVVYWCCEECQLLSAQNFAD
jgi:hypothetical protein